MKIYETLSPLALAFMGDAIHTAFVREYVLTNESNSKISNYHNLAKKFCNAKSQKEVLEKILPNLTNEEILSLAMIVPLFWGNDFEQATIPLEGTYGSMKGMGGRSLFSVDFDTNAKALQEMLYGAAE